jgi:ketosteroid isomerase-like protein
MKCCADGSLRQIVRDARIAASTAGACLALLLALPLSAQDTTQAKSSPAPAADVAAIRAAASAYREALARGDAAAIRAAWTADGDIVDSFGNIVPAGEVTAPGGERTPADRPAVRVGETRLRFIAPHVAVEDGAFDVTLPGTSAPLPGSFTALWVRQGDAWKLAGVREAERPVVADASSLEDLGWMVGEWVLVPEGDPKGKQAGSMEMTVRWDAAQAFLIREARLKPPEDSGDPVVELQQRIGWDPLVGRIRSWSFSTDGSRAEATWFRDGNSWIARGASVLPDGSQVQATNIYTYDGKDRFEWRVVQPPLASDEEVPTRATWVRKAGSTAR